MSRIGENIKKNRIKSGLSEKALAKKLGVSESFINEVESGRKVVNEKVIERISKVLNIELNDINMYADDTKENKENLNINIKTREETTKPKEINDLWNDAFSSVLKSVPVFEYDLKSIVSVREIPIKSNKIEGFAADKVLFLKIKDNQMTGFKISSGDIAFGHISVEINSNGIYLLDVNGERILRSVKKLDNSKVLLLYNDGKLITETIGIKEIKPLVKLLKVEITL